MARQRIWLDNILGTAFIFALMGLIFGISQFGIFDALDPIGEALEDMELTDIVFSEVRSEPPVDTNIVVVNIGNLPRGMIGQQIEVVNKYNPRVIGFDGFFAYSNTEDLQGDSILAEAIAKSRNFVLVTKLLQSDSLAAVRSGEDIFDSLEHTIPFIRGDSHEAFANLDTDAEYQQDFKACRAFPPARVVNDDTLVAFGVKMAQLYDPEITQRFLDRGNSWETINFRGNLIEFFRRTDYGTRFYALDWDDVLNENFTPNVIKDKVVIFGYLGEDFFDTSWDDKFFTPLNKKYAGKANPDMYGAVIHANIVSMILNEDYINTLGDKGAVILAILVCFLNVMLFSWIYRRLPRWYDGLTKLIQVLELILLGFVLVIVFDLFAFKLTLTLTMAAVALAGDALEVYYGVVKNLFRKESRKQLFTLSRNT